LICRNTSDLLTGGERYPRVTWVNEPRRNAPVTHTAGSAARVRATITVRLAGVGGGTPYVLQGFSAEPALCFRRKGTLPAGAEVVLALEAAHPLGKAVRKIRAPITWSLTVYREASGAATIDLGGTGPHVVYTTLGTPRDTADPLGVVTDVRMDLAVERVAAALAQAGDAASPPRIVYHLMKQNGEHYHPARHYGRARAWKVPETWGMKPRGASCISIVEFVVLLCKMIGIEGSVAMTAYYARPENPLAPVQGGLGDVPLFKRGFDNETWQLFLVDDTNSNRGQAGGVGGMNYYEAVLAYEWRGERYYYPGGTDRVFDSPDKVLRVFRTLAWARYDAGLRNWVVMEVVHTYVRPGGTYPPSSPIP
jgi:hypothetical protein